MHKCTRCGSELNHPHADDCAARNDGSGKWYAPAIYMPDSGMECYTANTPYFGNKTTPGDKPTTVKVEPLCHIKK
jgi:hypothetical protein